MSRRLLTLLVTVLFVGSMSATEEDVILNTATGDIHGKLLLPDSTTTAPLVIIIAGSGPTDMDGNTLGSDFRNNSLKLLAEALDRKSVV